MRQSTRNFLVFLSMMIFLFSVPPKLLAVFMRRWWISFAFRPLSCRWCCTRLCVDLFMPTARLRNMGRPAGVCLVGLVYEALLAALSIQAGGTHVESSSIQLMKDGLWQLFSSS